MATTDDKRKMKMAQAIYRAIVAKDQALAKLSKDDVLARLVAYIDETAANGGSVTFDPDQDNVPEAVIMAGYAWVNASADTSRGRSLEPAEVAALALLVRRSAPALGLLPFDEYFGDSRASQDVIDELVAQRRKVTDAHIDFYLKQAVEQVIGSRYRAIVTQVAERAGVKLESAVADAIVADLRRVGVTPSSSELVSETLRLAGESREQTQYRAAVERVLGPQSRETIDAIVEYLDRRGITPNQQGFEHYVFAARLEVQGPFTRGPRDVLAVAETTSTPIAFGDIRLPPLDTVADMMLYPDNIRHLGIAYFVMQFEELKVFRVADWLAREFLLGRLQVQFGEGGQRLYQYLKRRERRFTEADRLSFYRRVFGVGPGALPPDVIPNDAFPSLWMNLLVATTEYITGQRVGDLIVGAATPGTVSRLGNRERILRAARDLQTNLSQAGFGGAPWFAREIAAALQDTFDALSDRQLLSALGAPDAWTLVQRVAAVHLGGMMDVYQKKTMAEEGRGIFEWLADHHRDVYYVGDTELDRLVSLVERWLSVNIQGGGPALQPAPAAHVPYAPSPIAVAPAPAPAAPIAQPIRSSNGQARFSA